MATIDDVMDKLGDLEGKMEEIAAEVMAQKQIKQICGSCNGTGEHKDYDGASGDLGDPIITTCPDCDGAGNNIWGDLNTPA